MRDRPLLLGSLALVLAASGFGMLGPVARLAYETGIEPMAFVAWRATFGVLAILVIVAVRARRGSPLVNPARLRRADALGLVAIALLGLGVNVATFVAFDLTTVALVLLAFYTYPALVAIVAVVLGHERLDGSRLVALGLALGGMILVVAGGLDPAPGGIAFNPVGVILGLAAALCQTAFVTVSRGRFASVSPEQAMGWVILVIAASTLALAIVLGNPLDVPLHDGRALGLAVLAGVLGAGVPSVLLLAGIRAIGGTRSGILMLLEPLVGVTLAAVLLHESLLPVQVAGGAAILTAALLLQRDGGGAGRRERSGRPERAGEPDAISVPVAERV
jgi:drug/metabolite transporter (DMT)-like permease